MREVIPKGKDGELQELPLGRLLTTVQLQAEEGIGKTETWRRISADQYGDVFRDGARKILVQWEGVLRRRERFLKKAITGARKGRRRYERRSPEVTA